MRCWIAQKQLALGRDRRRKPVHGYKAHLATDQEARLIRSAAITTVNIHDAAELEAVLPRGL